MDNKEIGLFFDKKYIFDAVVLAEKIKDKIPDLGNPVILPIDEKSNNPVIIFEKSERIKLFVSLNNLLLHVNGDMYYKIKDCMKEIFSVLKNQKILVSRIGLINTVVLGNKERDLFANNAYDAKEIINSGEFQLSYFNIIQYEKIKLNCWKRYITNNDKFFVSFDINTIQKDSHDVDYGFAMDFITFASKYMEDNQIVKLY